MTDTALFADTEKRTIRGLLLPFDEMSSPSVSKTDPVMFSAGSVTLPADPVVVGANEGHSQFENRGHAISLEETSAGIVAEFAIARTPEGDALLASAANPDKTKRPRLSAEVAELVRSGARAVSARLTGAAFVPRGAFASAALFALSDAEAKSSYSSEYTDEDGVTWRRVETSETTTEPTENGETTTTVTTVTTEEEAPAEEAGEEEKEPVANATAPATGEFGAGSAPKALGKTGLFEAIINARQTGDRSFVEQLDAPSTGMFALNDIKISGASQVGTGVVQPQWLGELWSGRRFQRKVVPLLGHGDLQGLEFKGWRWGVKPQVAEWAGNKADIPTNTPTTTGYTDVATKFAGGHDIAREFVDFGVTEVLEGYTRHMVDSYAIKSDAFALTKLIAAAGAGTAAKVYPTIGGKTVSDAVGKIIQGALQVAAQNAVASWALVAPDVYELLAYTPKDMISEFLSQSLNLEETEGQVGFRVISHTGLAAGNVLVGAKEAATVLELPGSPIRVNALDIVRGGVDEALFGYIGVKVDYPEGLARIINRV